MRLGIFGGTFDPIHLGHLAAAEEAAHRLELTQVLFVPAHHQPLKDASPRASNDDRLAMVRLAIEGNPRFAVSSIELERPAPSYTVETLRILRREHGDRSELLLLVGVDAANAFNRWRAPDEILRLARLVIMSRSDIAEPNWALFDAILPGARGRVTLLAVPDIDLSSNELRRRVAAGEPIRYQVTESVREYVEARGLYGARAQAR